MADNLAALMQIAPTFGAFGIGQQMASNRETEAVNRQNTLQDVLMKQQEYGFNEQNNPLKLEQRRLGNVGIDLENQGKSLTNRKAAGTLESDIAAGNSDNQLKMLGNHIKQAEEHERKFGEWAQGIQQVPPAMRGQWLSQQLAANGMDPSNPQIQQFAQAAAQNPQLLVQSVQKIRQSRAEMTPAYIQAMAEARERSRSAANVANINAASAKEVANINGESRKAAAAQKAEATKRGFWEAMATGRIKAADAPGAILAARMKAATDEERQALDDLYPVAQALADKARPPLPSDVEDGKVTSRDRPEVRNPWNPNISGPKPGTIENGYKFKGGNPADPNSWEKQ